MNKANAKAKQFDPCSIFSARIKKAKFTAKPIKRDGSGVGGATDLIKKEAFLPVQDTAYARTIRLHEALHAIYTPKPTRKRIKSKRPYTMLEQAIEDARLHLNCARTSSSVRRDELCTALKDVHGATSKGAMTRITKPMAALLALRSAAILASQTDPTMSISARVRHGDHLRKVCSIVGEGYETALEQALDAIRHEDTGKAEALLKPYFGEEGETKEPWPMLVMAKEPGEDGVSFADVSFDKLVGKLTSDAAEMLSSSTATMVRDGVMPTLNIHTLFARDMVPTIFGETEKHVMCGTRIHAKKLATVVGPHTPKLFLREIRRNGGSVLIDASGSMKLSPDALLKLIQTAPVATIAFYNAPTDCVMTGNLWIYAHKGKRAADISDAKAKYGWGNVVDFQALQWLLALPAPRYFLTDGDFTGPYASRQAAQELLRNAIARKKVTQITSLEEMGEVLAKGGLR